MLAFKELCLTKHRQLCPFVRISAIKQSEIIKLLNVVER